MRVQQLKAVLIISVAGILGAGAWRSVAFGQTSNRQWKDQGEFDLFTAMTKEANP